MGLSRRELLQRLGSADTLKGLAGLVAQGVDGLLGIGAGSAVSLDAAGRALARRPKRKIADLISTGSSPHGAVGARPPRSGEPEGDGGGDPSGYLATDRTAGADPDPSSPNGPGPSPPPPQRAS